MKKPARTPEAIIPLVREKLEAENRNSLDIGKLLLEAQEQLREQRWGNWLDQNFAMSQSTAERYMAAAIFAKKQRLAAVTVTNMSCRLLYSLAQGRHEYPDAVVEQILKVARKRRVGVTRANLLARVAEDEKRRAEGRPIVTELERLEAAREQAAVAEAEERAEADAILDGAPPELPPPPEPAVTELLLPAFDRAVETLRTLHTKPRDLFVATAHRPEDLESVAEFLRYLADTIRRKRTAA